MDIALPPCEPFPQGMTVASIIDIRNGLRYESYPADAGHFFSTRLPNPVDFITNLRRRQFRRPFSESVVIPIRIPRGSTIAAIEIGLEPERSASDDGPSPVAVYLSPCERSITVWQRCIALPPNTFRATINGAPFSLSGDCVIEPDRDYYLVYSVPHRELLTPFRPETQVIDLLSWTNLIEHSQQGALCRERCAVTTTVTLLFQGATPIVIAPPEDETQPTPTPSIPALPPITYPEIKTGSRAELIVSLGERARAIDRVTDILSPPSSGPTHGHDRGGSANESRADDSTFDPTEIALPSPVTQTPLGEAHSPVGNDGRSPPSRDSRSSPYRRQDKASNHEER